jgi:hypothetical protein
VGYSNKTSNTTVPSEQVVRRVQYEEPQSPYINIANEDPREDPGTQSRVSRDPIPLFFLSGS